MTSSTLPVLDAMQRSFRRLIVGREQPTARAALFAACLVAVTALPGRAIAAVADAAYAIRAGDCETAGREINAGLRVDDPQAYFLAGFLYDRSNCVVKDPARAAGLYRKASALGDRDAPVYLGLMYGLGRGVPQDYAQAHRAFLGTDREDAAVGGATASLPDDVMLGYVETVGHMAERDIGYPITANSTGIEANLDVVLEPATGRISFDHVKIDAETGSSLARTSTFENPLEEAYRTAIAALPKPVAASGASVTSAYATPWQFRMRRDPNNHPLRLEGYVTIGPARVVH